MPNFSFLSGSYILVQGGVGLGGFTVILIQISVQIGLNLTGLELSMAIFPVFSFEGFPKPEYE